MLVHQNYIGPALCSNAMTALKSILAVNQTKVFQKGTYSSQHINKKLADTESNFLVKDLNRLAETSNFSSFRSCKEISDWTSKHFGELEKSLCNEEISILKNYCYKGYMIVNRVLREGTCCNDESDIKAYKMIDILDEIVHRSIIPNNITVYRGASRNAFGPFRHLRNDELIGKVISDRAFMSTTLLGYTAANFDQGVVFKIDIPAGTHGIFMGNFSTFDNEHELLLKRNRHMIIKDISEDEDGVNVHCQLISD
jgi:hypothetical protein